VITEPDNLSVRRSLCSLDMHFAHVSERRNREVGDQIL
jgi:hypothetical protein